MSRTTTKTKKKYAPDAASNTRDKILDITEQLLHEKGYMGMSMGEVAERIGIRQAALYYHFPEGKEQMCLEVAYRIMERDARGFAKSVNAKRTAKAQLVAVAEWCASKPSTDVMIQDMARFVDPQHRKEIGRLFINNLYMPIHKVLSQGIAKGEFRPHNVEAVSWMFLSMLSRLEAASKHSRPQEMAYTFVETFIKGIHK
jgi:AcrR family transcriptional regulator